MTVTTPSVGRDAISSIRDRIDHPIIDGDGHVLEFLPLVFDFVREEAGEAVFRRLQRFNRERFRSSEGFLPVRVFHGLPAENTLDRMTVTLPQLLYGRLHEIGIDYALLYPSFGLTLLSHPDDEVRQPGARALNRYFAEVFDGFRDRLEPVAVIPTFTPAEAVAALDHAVGTLGLKAVVMSGVVPRTVRPDGAPASWIDTLGHESLYDYDPVWARCTELGVVPTFHGIGYGWGTRVSSRNYVHNHLGNFAAAQEGACRALVMGGVMSRFPELRFAFLEGGVAWACQLCADLVGHYEKRNRDVVGRYDESRIDLDVVMQLFDEHAHGPLTPLRDRMEGSMRRTMEAAAATRHGVDDFADAGFASEDDILAMFSERLYFGCEADDPMNALAFDTRLVPTGARLNAVFASDIGHWDVPDVTRVVPEAWELVEHGLIDEAAFRDFAFGNVATMLTATNPAFFAGTTVEHAVASSVGADIANGRA